MTLKGEKLDKPSYAILRSLHGGRTGAVHEVDHKVFGRRCVQKTYSTLGLEDAVAHGEPRLLHSITHPHVAEVLEAQYDPEVEDGITFVTVFYEGGSIADALDEGYRWSTHQAIEVVIQVLDALAHVHSKHNVIHRDVKPGNIFLDGARSNARLGDFGSAAAIEADGAVAGIEGSPLYTPPEGGPSGDRLDVSGDVYGAAMTLFEMLNGPFDYACIDRAGVDRRLARGYRALPESAFVFAPHVPDAPRRVVRKGLRSDPRQRFRSPAAFIAALQRLRLVDWKHEEGEGLDGLWRGSWPPHLARHKRRVVSVHSYRLAAGNSRGQRRLEGRQAVASARTPARFGVVDATEGADDRIAVERFFAAVDAKAAHRAPTR